MNLMIFTHPATAWRTLILPTGLQPDEPVTNRPSAWLSTALTQPNLPNGQWISTKKKNYFTSDWKSDDEHVVTYLYFIFFVLPLMWYT